MRLHSRLDRLEDNTSNQPKRVEATLPTTREQKELHQRRGELVMKKTPTLENKKRTSLENSVVVESVRKETARKIDLQASLERSWWNIEFVGRMRDFF